MARIRSIKPEFWSDDSVTECSLTARLLFIGIWNFADDFGNLDRSAKQIKTRVFPVDAIDCEPLIQELLTHGLLIEYSVSGKLFLHIPGFAKHQVINRPSSPAYPAFDDSLRTHGILTEDSVSTHAGGEGKGREGKGGEGTRPPAVSAAALNGRHSKLLSPGGSKSSAGSRLPEDFALTPTRREYAAQHRVDPVRVFESFSDYWKSVPGARGKKLDWDATWRTWVRREAERNPPAKGGGNGLPFAN